MGNLAKYPLQDAYETTLAQAWDGQTGDITVNTAPSFTFPSGITTYIVVDPGKTTMQIAEINAFDAGLKTITVNNITLEKGAGINSTAVNHTVGAKVIISDNYQFWLDILTAVNSKINDDGSNLSTSGDVTFNASGGDLIFADASNAPIDLSTIAAAAGADTKVAISVGDTTPSQLEDKLTAGDGVTLTKVNPLGNESFDLDIDLTDTVIFSDAGVASRAAKTDGSGNLFQATTTARGGVEMLTDAEATTGTDETRYLNSKQGKDNYGNKSQLVSVGTLTFDDVAQSNITINHSLGVVPTKLDFIFPEATSVRRIGQWADNGGTKTSYARFNDGSFSRTTTTNETIANFDDSNNSNGEWRVDSVSTTQVILSYTIVNDGGSWTPTTETGVFVSIRN